jgi:hypothetical protein
MLKDFTAAAAPDGLVSPFDSTASIARSFRSMCGSSRNPPRCSKQRFPAATPHVGQGTASKCFGVTSPVLTRKVTLSPFVKVCDLRHHKECGLEGLTGRARTPYRYANKPPAQIEAMIVTMRREKPTWGARKLRERLLRKLPNDVRVPACSTIHAITDRHVARAQKPKAPLSEGLAPNGLWCTDYKASERP